jgi:hypothetical protein
MYNELSSGPSASSFTSLRLTYSENLSHWCYSAVNATTPQAARVSLAVRAHVARCAVRAVRARPDLARLCSAAVARIPVAVLGLVLARV